jgi:preprotein translocase subunit YajC
VSYSPSPDTLLFAQNVQPKGGTPGVAQDPGASPASGGGASHESASPLAGMMPILMMLVIFVPFFLLMNRRQKKEATARSSLKRGDKVMTNSGLIGELIEMDERIAKVKIADGVKVQIVANTISPYVEPASTSKEPAKDLKEAKALPEKK